jgi:hypothetical protein
MSLTPLVYRGFVPYPLSDEIRLQNDNQIFIRVIDQKPPYEFPLSARCLRVVANCSAVDPVLPVVSQP